MGVPRGEGENGMKQIWITQYGGPETLQLREGEMDPPGRGQVTVAVKAAGINFADLMARKGLYPDAPKPPCVVGYEISGVVESLGQDVDPQWAGKSVVAFTRFGGYSEKVTLSSQQIFEKPAGLTFEQAASLPVNYLTAYQLVVVMGGLRKGETVLIHNAGGGVGLAALQIAKHLGAVTLGTASAVKHPTLLRMSLDHAIDYRSEDWEGKVREITGGRGVELILDPIGGANWKKNYRLLRSTGRLGFFGVSAASEKKALPLLAFLSLLPRVPFYQPIGLMNGNKGVFGVNLGHLWEEADKTRGWFMEILKGVKEGWVKPHVDRSYFFSEAAQAHQFMEERKNLGKVLLVP